jgi:hypothetical protein
MARGIILECQAMENQAMRMRTMAGAIVFFAVILAGCGGSPAGVSATTGGATKTPAATATPNIFGSPTPEPTGGPPCHGGEWSTPIIPSVEGIVLPPQTVAGAAENIPSGSWTAFYEALCTGGNIDGINAFLDSHMAAAGWTEGPAPSDCDCNGRQVWTKPNDARLVQFEPNPNQTGGDVRWGIFIYSR